MAKSASSSASARVARRRFPSVDDVVDHIGVPASDWPGRCDEIARMALGAGLYPDGKAHYGCYHGPVSPRSIFADDKVLRPQHGWIVLTNGTVIDLTRWVFEASDPYIAQIPRADPRHRQYDLGGVGLDRMINGVPGAPGPDAVLGNATVARPCPLDTADPAALRFIHLHFHCLPSELTRAQVHWLAHQRPGELGKAARPIFQAIEKAGMGGSIPIDLWRAVIE